MSEEALAPEAQDAVPTIARVLLDSQLPQLDHLFDYAIPESLRPHIRRGQRVTVPFRSRTRDTLGYVIDLSSTSAFTGDLAPISGLVSPVPMVTPEVWALARAVSERAAGSVNDVLRLAIPARRVRVEKQFLARREETATATEASDAPPLTFDPEPRERSVASLLSAGERLALTTVQGPIRLETGEWVHGWANDFARIALTLLAEGRSVIVVVPDYRDLDQVCRALETLGYDAPVRVDARQAAGERYEHFLTALQDHPSIIVGNRSAVYAPAFRLGAILMWDDGDPALDEPLTPYVHPRDAALVRAEQSGAGLLFAAHARSAELHRLIEIGYVRPGKPPAPRVRIVHSGSLAASERAPGRVPALATRMLREGLSQGPVLVQVATPGYAPIAVCRRCGDLARCLECAGPLRVQANGTAVCRWCGAGAAGWHCRVCQGDTFERRGAGSERTAEQFQQMFPDTPVILSDGAHPRNSVDARPAVVVATRGAEPFASGGYRAIALLDIERLLGAETLRAGEDCLRWWSNAAALAAPEAVCVVAGGNGPIVQAFVTGRTEEWLSGELQDRQELRYPPAVRVASVVGEVSAVTRAVAPVADTPGVDTLGPVAMGDGNVRVIVRFDYARGADVAATLRAELVADARGSRRGSLRLHFDDRDVFDVAADTAEHRPG